MVWLSGKTIAKLCLRNTCKVADLSAIGAILFAFTPLIWEYSTTAEVFALNNFLCAGLLLLLCLTVAAIDRLTQVTVKSTSVEQQAESTTQAGYILRLSMLGGLFCGLALANQHASALFVVCVVPTVLLFTGLYTNPLVVPVLLRAAGGGLLGLSTYLYLPWAASQRTYGSWGELRTWSGFLKHVLRAEYGTFRLGMVVGSETSLERIWIYLRHTSEESFHVAFPVLFVGLAVIVIRGLRANSVGRPRRLPAATTAAASANARGQKQKSRGSNNNHIAKVTVEATAPAQPGATSGLPASGGAIGWQLLLAVALMWAFYTLVWHGVFSNLPLSAPMPFAVHSRFWMQPNILLYTLCCCAIEIVTTTLFPGDRGDVDGLQTSLPPVPHLHTVTALAVVVAMLSGVLYVRLPAMDKSVSGDVMLRYGESILNAAMQSEYTQSTQTSAGPLHSLLLSHTDLDWNPVRYLQHCEGAGLSKDAYYQKSPLRAWTPPRRANLTNGLVTHLSFQLMPYPWFLDTQAGLYPHVSFPNLSFAGVSTDRMSEGNAQLVTRFLLANNAQQDTYQPTDTDADSRDAHSLPVLRSTHRVFDGGIYLDMQSVQESEIEALGAWRGFTLIPWATQYRVFGKLHMPQVLELHHYSWDQLRRLQRHFPIVNEAFMVKFPAGSWERAAANVYYDAHYQFGLNILTYCIEAQAEANLKTLPLLLDRYHLSAQVLWTTLQAVQKYGTFSSSRADLSKNTALAWMRLHGLMGIVQQFNREVTHEVERRQALHPSLRSQVNDAAALCACSRHIVAVIRCRTATPSS